MIAYTLMFIYTGFVSGLTAELPKSFIREKLYRISDPASNHITAPWIPTPPWHWWCPRASLHCGGIASRRAKRTLFTWRGLIKAVVQNTMQTQAMCSMQVCVCILSVCITRLEIIILSGTSMYIAPCVCIYPWNNAHFSSFVYSYSKVYSYNLCLAQVYTHLQVSELNSVAWGLTKWPDLSLSLIGWSDLQPCPVYWRSGWSNSCLCGVPWTLHNGSRTLTTCYSWITQGPFALLFMIFWHMIRISCLIKPLAWLIFICRAKT